MALTSPMQKTPAPALSHLRSFPALVALFGVVLIVGIWLFAIKRMDEEYARTLTRAEANAVEYAASFEERTASSVRQIDQALRVIQFSVAEHNDPAAVGALLKLEGLLPSDLAILIFVTDASGNLVAASRPFNAINIADREHFRVHAERQSDALFIGPPIVGRITQQLSIQFSRRLARSDGAFLGVAGIGIDPTYFLRAYDTARLGQRGAIGLVGLDGVLRARRVGNETFVGERSLIMVPPSAQGTSGAATKNTESAFDQERRITAFKRLGSYPLVAFVGLSDDEVLTEYRNRRPGMVLAATIVSLIIAACIAFMARQGLQIERARRAADAARATFVGATEASLDALYILKSDRDEAGQIRDFVFVEVNARGAELIVKQKSEILGQKLCELLPVTRTSGLFDKFVKVAETGERLEEEFAIDSPDVAARWLQHQVVRVEDGIAITSRNISPRKQAEAELRSSRAYFQTLIDHLPSGVYVKSMRDSIPGRFVLWNDAAGTITGYPAARVIGRTDREVFPARFAGAFEHHDRAMLDDPMVMTTPELRFERPDGSARVLRVTVVPIFDDQKRVAFTLGVSDDITELKHGERELAEQRAELEAMHNASPLGQFRADARGRLTHVNETIERMTGYTRAVLLAGGSVDTIHPDDRNHVVTAWREAIASGGRFDSTHRIVRPGGQILWAVIKAAPVRVGAEVTAFVGTLDDITEAKSVELALRESETTLRTITDALPMRVSYIDTDERYRFNNLAYETYYGIPRERLVGMSLREVLGDEFYNRNAGFLQRAMQGETVVYEMDHEVGAERRTFRVTVIPHRAEGDGPVLGVYLIAQDISAQKSEQQRLSRIAECDPLTGLLNRGGFEERLADMLRNASAAGAMEPRIALMYLDVDRFKDINDKHGHGVGDMFLKAFAERLKRCVRASDTVARIGGDEFTIVLERMAHPGDAAHVAAKIVQAMQEPFDLVGVALNATTSIGIAFYEPSAGAAREPTGEVAALIKRADAMLYQAKAGGRNGFRMEG